MSGDLDSWILVVDSDATSQRQVQICRELRPALRGVEDCSRPDANQRLCHETSHFPSFCHVDTRSCVSGLRTTTESFEALASLKTGG